MDKNKKKKTAAESEDQQFPLPIYESSEDIYNKEKEVSIDDTGKVEPGNKLNKEEDLAAGLDIPGSELDDLDENIGEEDEENNYYSLGGDNHDDLEETNEDLAGDD